MKRSTAFFAVKLAAVLILVSWVPAPGALAEDPTAETGSGSVVAFYFHGNVRCATCKKIESYAGEAVRQGFPQALQNGALEWRVVNIDEAENQHFIQDFQLVTRSVVLAEYSGEKVLRWKNLDKVWQLVRSKDTFVEYVQDETRQFLGMS
jgi:hypothetical protein